MNGSGDCCCCHGMYGLIKDEQTSAIAKLHIIMLWLIVCVLIVIFVIGYGRIKEHCKMTVPKTVVNSLSEGFRLVGTKI